MKKVMTVFNVSTFVFMIHVPFAFAGGSIDTNVSNPQDSCEIERSIEGYDGSS